MGAADIVIASNRGPVGFRRDADGSLHTARGAGGLVSGMAGLSTDRATLWVCAALSDTDREVASAAPDRRLDLAGYDTGGAVEMLPIDQATFAAAYNTISNSTLWFIHHELLDSLPTNAFDDAWRHDWSSYVDYNRAFADAIVEAAAEDAKVLVQDYHLTLLPAMLRSRRPDLRIAHFSHTPWASPPVFETLPADIARDLLVGMLGADSVGFHSRRWARDFLGCCVAVLGAENVDGDVRYDGRLTTVRVHPLGVDAEPLLARAAEADVVAKRAERAAEVGDRQAIVRVDRTEPSKNIVRGLAAYRELLSRFPDHRDRVVQLALAYPSRQDVEEYRQYTHDIEELAAAINAEFETPSWTPVIVTIDDDYPLSLATLQLGDVQLINPVRDGMNLVAKEAALLSRDAVLVLSHEAGAADQMGEDALLVDPFDISATATALHEALVMPADERARRHAGLVAAATVLSPHDWLQHQLDSLA